MQVSLTIDDDVYAYVQSHAQRMNLSLGEALTQFARDGIRARSLSRAALPKPSNDYSLLPARDEIITPDWVRYWMDREVI
jgi:hypothetical protein